MKDNSTKIIIDVLHAIKEIHDYKPSYYRGDHGHQTEDKEEHTYNIINEILQKYGKYIECTNCKFDLWYENGGVEYKEEKYCSKCYQEVLRKDNNEIQEELSI